MEKTIKLRLKVDTKPGEDSIKKLTNSLKGMSTSMAGGVGGAGMGAMGAGMLVMGTSTLKAASAITKLSKSTAISIPLMGQLIEKGTLLARNEVDYVIKMAKGTKVAEKRLRNMEAIGKEYVILTKGLNKAGSAQQNLTNKTKAATRAVDKHKKAYKGFWGILAKVRHHYLALITTAAIATVTLGSFFKKGFGAVEKYKLSVASLAATITSFAKVKDKGIAETYKEAYKYSSALVLKMEEWNAKSLATGENINAMVAVMAQSGVLIDINNQKQEEGVVAISNAIAVMTQGQDQEKQFRQEIRALMAGEARAGSILAQMIRDKVGNLKEAVAQWKKEGTLIENLKKHLEGFAEASKDIQFTWAAVGTTMGTIANRILRRMFLPVYKVILKTIKSINDLLLSQNDTVDQMVNFIKNELLVAWDTVKNTTSGVVNLLIAFSGPLGAVLKTVNLIASGWSLIFKHTSSWIRSLGKFLESKYFAKSIGGSKDSLTIEQAQEIKALKQKLKVSERNLIYAEEKGYEGLIAKNKKRIAQYNTEIELLRKKFKLENAERRKDEVPEMATPFDEEKMKRVASLQKELTKEQIKIAHSGYEEKKKLHVNETAFLLSQHHQASTEYYLIQKTQALKLQQLKKDEAEEATNLTKKNVETVRAYNATELENTIYAIRKERDEAIAAAKAVGASELVLFQIRQTANTAIFTETQTSLQVFLGAEKEKQEALKTTYGEWLGTMNSFKEDTIKFSIQAAESLADGVTNGLWDFIEGTKSANEALKDFARSYAREIGTMIAKTLMLKAIQKAVGFIGGLGSGVGGAIGGGAVGGGVAATGASTTGMYASPMLSAKGNAFDQYGSMMKFAKGGVVNSATPFMSNSGPGVMGEGMKAEGILPLSKASGGELGVKAVGMQGNVTNQTVNINAVDYNSFSKMLKRDPGAIVEIIDESLRERSGLLNTMRRTI